MEGGPLFRATDRRLSIDFGQGFFLRIQWDIRWDPEENLLESKVLWQRSQGENHFRRSNIQPTKVGESEARMKKCTT